MYYESKSWVSILRYILTCSTLINALLLGYFAFICLENMIMSDISLNYVLIQMKDGVNLTVHLQLGFFGILTDTTVRMIAGTFVHVHIV